MLKKCLRFFDMTIINNNDNNNNRVSELVKSFSELLLSFGFDIYLLLIIRSALATSFVSIWWWSDIW